VVKKSKGETDNDATQVVPLVVAAAGRHFVKTVTMSAEQRALFAAMPQGGPEWKDVRERVSFLFASWASIICGWGFDVSPQRFWAIKMGLEPEEQRTPEAIAHMARGTRWEPLIRDGIYTRMTGLAVRTTGLHVHPTHPWLACSPDGLVDGGGVEFKCTEVPLEVKAAKRRYAPSVPPWHMFQLQMCLGCIPEAQFWDYLSFSPSPADARLTTLPDALSGGTGFMVRVWRSQPFWDKMFGALDRFADALVSGVCPTDLPVRMRMPEVRVEPHPFLQ
jgi:hypothetical protein